MIIEALNHKSRTNSPTPRRSARRRMVAALLVCLFVWTDSKPFLRAADDPPTADELALIREAEADRIQAVERVYGSVVAIYGNNRQGGGSGVLYDSEGFALTNHHVIAGAGGEGWAGLADGRLYRWKLVGTDPGGDIAVIRLTGQDRFPAAPLGDSDTVRVGDFAMAMGNPFTLAEDQRPTVTLGVVSGVRRYQPGAGNNMLEYGNCIQVDSSINPGNSGGPLFNIAGEVIGINGRGSFKERGRVNVGLGYAVSINQIRNFIPDLLATKVAQHGTLDAQFGDRTGGVICEAINLDSPAARAGLKLGDRLVSFEGEPIERANEFTNLISTLPADWPVELVCERDGARHTIRVRLVPLPYGPQPKREEAKRKLPKEDDAEEDGGKERPVEAPRPGQEKPRPTPPRRGFQMTEPGKVRDVAQNRENARRLLARWREFAGTDGVGSDGPVKAFRIRDDVFRGGQKVGRQELVIAADGRFRLEFDIDGTEETVLFDGRDFLRPADPAGKTEEIGERPPLDGPFALQAAVLAAMFRDEPLKELGEAVLSGGDKALGQRAYRVEVTAGPEARYFVWLAVEEFAGPPHVRLLKTGHTLDGNRPHPSVGYDDWRTVAGVKFPFRRTIVAGLAETVDLELRTEACDELPSVPDDFPRTALSAREFSREPAASARPRHDSRLTTHQPGPFSAAIARAQARTVKVLGAGIGREPGYATGVVVSPDGHVLVAHGIYLAGERIRAVLPDGSVHLAKVERRSTPLQTALLKIDAPTPDYFELSEKPPVRKGDWVLAVTNAFKVADGPEPLSVTLGVVSLITHLDAKHGTQDVPYDAELLVIDAITSNPGAPGGALVTADGRLAGMIGKIIESHETHTRINYAVPAHLLAKFVVGKPLESADPPMVASGKAELGIRLFGFGGKRSPAYIDRVRPGSPAAKAGLKPDDLIVAIGGRRIANIGEYDEALESLVPGNAVELLVKRKQTLMRVTIVPVAEDK